MSASPQYRMHHAAIPTPNRRVIACCVPSVPLHWLFCSPRLALTGAPHCHPFAGRQLGRARRGGLCGTAGQDLRRGRGEKGNGGGHHDGKIDLAEFKTAMLSLQGTGMGMIRE